jgi:hypothetical protein
MAARLWVWLFTVSCVAAYMALKFTKDLPYDAMEPPLLSMAAMLYPCCEAGTLV